MSTPGTRVGAARRGARFPGVNAAGVRRPSWLPGGPQQQGGYLYPGDAPGLGVDIDEELASRYPLHADMAQFSDGVVDWTQTRLPDGTLTRP